MPFCTRNAARSSTKVARASRSATGSGRQNMRSRQFIDFLPRPYVGILDQSIMRGAQGTMIAFDADFREQFSRAGRKMRALGGAAFSSLRPLQRGSRRSGRIETSDADLKRPGALAQNDHADAHAS